MEPPRADRSPVSRASATRLLGQVACPGRGGRIAFAFLLSVAATVLAFLLLASIVSEGEAGRFDRAILLAMREPGDPSQPVGPLWLELAARDITSLGGYPVVTLVTLLTAGLLLIVHKRGTALLVLVSVGGGMLLSMTLKNVYERPRPDLVPHEVAVYTSSFPSGHAMLSAVTYLTLGALLARVEPRRRVRTYLVAIAVMLTLMIGASRIYLGVHWPTDVLAGWCAGAGWAALCWSAALWLQRRGRIESPAPDAAENGANGAR